MINCPNCNREQNKWKLLTLNNFNSIICPGCGVKLKSDRFRSSIFGAFGGGVGTLIGIQLVRDGYSPFWWGVVVIFIAVLIIAQLSVTKLYEVKT